MTLSKSNFNGDIYGNKDNNATSLGHVECMFSSASGQWSEPRFVNSPLLMLDGLAPGLNYGQQIFEGLKARRHPNGDITIFRPQDHASRMQRSASYMSMPEIPQELFLKCVHLVVSKNAYHVYPHDFNGSLYIRPIEFGSSALLPIEPPAEFMFCVYVQQVAGSLSSGSSNKALVLDYFDRAATRGVGVAKAGGNYAPVMRWIAKAQREGFDFLLHLDSRTQSEIEEFSWSGFVGVRRTGEEVGVVLSSSDAIIASITVDCIAVLSKSFGWTVEKRPVKFTELSTFTEVFAAGTAVGITPVSTIHRQSTNETFRFDTHGPCYRMLWDMLLGIQKGTVEDRFGWCTKLNTVFDKNLSSCSRR